MAIRPLFGWLRPARCLCKSLTRTLHTSSRLTSESTTSSEPILQDATWSVRALLKSDPNAQPTITPSQLHHLLRLSALPQPKTKQEELEMLRTLESQLHFVRDIQSVDTAGVEPLQAIRDETEDAVRERTIGLGSLQDSLAQEEDSGKTMRPRRRKIVLRRAEAELWDTLGQTSRKQGGYFVVESGVEKEK